MDKEAIKKMMGMKEAGGAFYNLNKITMSGDDGAFKFTDLTSEREKGDKPLTKDLGKTVEGVILKMRWVLQRWDEPSKTFYSSTEYDDKWKDTVTVFPNKDKGDVTGMKEKYQLKTLRVLYFFLPESKEVVRLYVKASALSGKGKNVDGELGLFEYEAEFANDEMLLCQVFTTCEGVFRAGKNEGGSPNKRKDHYAMTFSRGKELTDEQFEKIVALIQDVDTKTKTKVAADVAESDDETEDADEHGEATKTPLDKVIDGEDPISAIPF